MPHADTPYTRVHVRRRHVPAVILVFLAAFLGVTFGLRPGMAAVSRLAVVQGKTVVIVRGRPCLMYGVQMRLDDFLGSDRSPARWSRAKVYFQKAREAGFRMVIVPVAWSAIEPTEGRYEFGSYVDRVIEGADTYGLDVQLLWYGSDVCGWDDAPQYVEKDVARFPRNANYPRFLDLSGSALVGRESAALAALMAHVAAYDTHRRVIMVQVENEPDGAADVPVDWGSTADREAKLFAGGQYPAVRSLINALARVVHQSPRDVVTRCNGGTDARIDDLFRTRDGVDVFGVDSYQSKPDALKRTLNSLPVETPGNVPHQPEGGGQYAALIRLILSNFEEGGGYQVYELRTVGRPYDLGIYRKTTPDADAWQERDGSQAVPYALSGAAESDGPENDTQEIRDFNRLIAKADAQIAVARKGSCAAFGITGAPGPVDETRTVGSVTVGYRSASGAPAFALQETGGGVLLMSLKGGSTFTLGHGLLSRTGVSVGRYDRAGHWFGEGIRRFQAHTLTLGAGEVARIPTR